MVQCGGAKGAAACSAAGSGYVVLQSLPTAGHREAAAGTRHYLHPPPPPSPPQPQPPFACADQVNPPPTRPTKYRHPPNRRMRASPTRRQWRRGRRSGGSASARVVWGGVSGRVSLGGGIRPFAERGFSVVDTSGGFVVHR